MEGSARSRSRVTEAQFTEAVIDLAKFRGWKVTHFRVAWTEKGWRTPLQGDAGFPDLVLARRGSIIIAELKTEKGKVTRAQAGWANALGSVYRLWRPSDMDDITRELM
jgi:carbohydrate-selective porin OprB